MVRWVAGVVIAGLFSLWTGTAVAGPWAEAGDRQLRNDIEILAQFGLIRGPITTWPLPWAQISSRLKADTGKPLPPHVRMALARVRAKMPSARDFGRPLLKTEARATNRAKLSRDFGNTARDEVDASVSAEMNWSATSARLSVGYQGNDVDDTLSFDGSYLAFALGNWMIYGGWIDHWWGPGWASGLIVSTNARPAPRIGLMRLNPRPFGTPLLRWLGPWQFNVFLGQLDDDERLIRNPYYMGFRFAFEPLDNFEIGLSRTMMLCGKDQQCGFKTWTNVLIGVGNVENPGLVSEDPGNQLGGADFRWSFGVSDHVTLALFGQLIGEDEKDFLPFKFAKLAGFSVDGPWGDRGAHWRFITEYTDTAAGLIRDTQFNVVYNHSRYRSGYRYHGRSLGDRLDGDSRAWSFTALFTDSENWTWRANYERARINIDGTGVHGISANAERINIFEAGVQAPSRFGNFDLEVRYEDDRPNTPGESDSATAIEFGWAATF
ncbi:MAG: capsule assembly Wzi family protein [Alphaproteobacteria bacterium]|nr:MAG: capsule assembly Wzi family protein [Alphaproteobacteria bacterium]